MIVIGDNWYDYELQIFGDIFDQMNDLEWSLFQHHIWKHKVFINSFPSHKQYIVIIYMFLDIYDFDINILIYINRRRM